jgi:urea ABC transporter urea binding protein
MSPDTPDKTANFEAGNSLKTGDSGAGGNGADATGEHRDVASDPHRTVGPSAGTDGSTDGTSDYPVMPDLSFLGPAIEKGDIGQLGGYRVRRILGIGGMGIVFEALDPQLRRPVALKVMRPELAVSLGARTRFIKEARAAAALTSDHIVTVYQVGQDNDVPFMAMQLLRGEALDTRLARDGRMSVLDTLTVAIQAATGLAAAHEAGMIHRDIKPANLWLETKEEAAKKAGESGRLLGTVTGPDTSFRVKILDMGLVRGGGGPRLTTAGVVVGTPHFMAPEQASGAEIDHRADLFSLGCVIYTMLTGELAFPGKSTMAVLMALANHRPAPIHELNSEVPFELSQFVSRMIAKSREERPASALAVIELLTEILTTETEKLTQAPPPKRSGAVKWETVRRVPLPELKSRAGVPIVPEGRHPLAGTKLTPRPIEEDDGNVFPGALATPSPETVPTPMGSPVQHEPAPVAAPLYPPTPVPEAKRLTGGNPVVEAAPPTNTPPPPSGGHYAALDPLANTSSGAPSRGVSGQSIGIGVGLVSVAIAIIVLGIVLGLGRRGNKTVPVDVGDPIRVGVLHSKTGPMSFAESPVIDATQLAIDEVNQAGGINGRRLLPIVIDGKSDSESFATAADKLLSEEKVAVVFGCWTSASRKAVRPVFERQGGLLLYPVHYEGLEQSPRIVYLGPTPNQQVIPALDFVTKTLGKKRLFLVGSDYVFPRAVAAIIEDQVKRMPEVKIVGSEFVPLGAKDVSTMIALLKVQQPDAIINTLNSTTNFAFFRELQTAGITPTNTVIVSTSISENELRTLDPAAMAESYLAGSYFQTVDRKESKEFVAKVKARYGDDRVVSDEMASAYSGVHMWAKAVASAGKPDPDAVLSKLRGMSYASPGGTIKIDPTNQHTWQHWRIGKVRADALVDVVASSPDVVAPIPYLDTRTRIAWDHFLSDLNFKWEGRWQAPQSP